MAGPGQCSYVPQRGRAGRCPSDQKRSGFVRSAKGPQGPRPQHLVPVRILVYRPEQAIAPAPPARRVQHGMLRIASRGKLAPCGRPRSAAAGGRAHRTRRARSGRAGASGESPNRSCRAAPTRDRAHVCTAGAQPQCGIPDFLPPAELLLARAAEMHFGCGERKSITAPRLESQPVGPAARIRTASTSA
jgi:hypothetical protein